MSLNITKIEDMADGLTEKIALNYEFLYFNGKRDAIRELKRALLYRNEFKTSKDLIEELQELDDLYEAILTGIKNGTL